MDTTDISFLLTVSQIPRPTLVETLILDENNTYTFYDLKSITDNGYVEILNEFSDNKTIDYFFVTDSDYGTLDFYEGFFDIYITP